MRLGHPATVLPSAYCTIKYTNMTRESADTPPPYRHEFERLRAERRDALEREGQHLAERVLARAGEPLRPRVVDDAARVADETHQPAQEQVHLVEFRQRAKGALAHETVIGVVVQDIGAELLHDLVIALRERALEKRIRFPRFAHRVHDVAALVILGEHSGNDVDIVLQIGIKGNHGIESVLRMHQACKKRILMAAVTAELEAGIQRISIMQIAYEPPSSVDRSVVNEQDAAFANLPGVDEPANQNPQTGCRFAEHFLFVVARYDDTEARRLPVRAASLPALASVFLTDMNVCPSFGWSRISAAALTLMMKYSTTQPPVWKPPDCFARGRDAAEDRRSRTAIVSHRTMRSANASHRTPQYRKGSE